MSATLVGAESESGLLQSRERISLVQRGRFDPRKYYRYDNQPKHWLRCLNRACSVDVSYGRSFLELVVTDADPVPHGTRFSLRAFNLKDTLSDMAIVEAVDGTIFDSCSDLCAIIAILAEQNRDPKSGVLARGNVFYANSCVISLGWSSTIQSWGIRTWGRSSGRGGVWEAGTRVFAPVM